MLEEYQQAVSVANFGGIRDVPSLYYQLGLKSSPQVPTCCQYAKLFYLKISEMGPYGGPTSLCLVAISCNHVPVLQIYLGAILPRLPASPFLSFFN